MPAFDGFNLSQPFEPLPYLTPAEEEGDERLPSERAPLPPLDPRGLPPPLLPQNQVPLPPLDAERTDELLSSARKRLQARLQESTIVPSSVFIDDSGAVCACVTVPKGTKGSVLVDVWPHAEPKVLVTKPVPHGLNPGDTFLAKLVESHERRERGIVRAHCAEGECDYTFDADGSIGVVIEAAKRGPKGRKPQLLISEVKRGTWAERLGVPAEGAITKVNGVVLKGSADQQMQQATLLVRSRPLNLTVLTKPKHSSVTTKASASLFGFRKAAKAQPPVPTPIVATPADSDRSDRPAHKAPVHDAAAAVQVM